MAPMCDCGSAVRTRSPGATTSLAIRKRGPAMLDWCVWITGFGRPVVPDECRIDTGSSSAWRKRFSSGRTPAGGRRKVVRRLRPAHVAQRARLLGLESLEARVVAVDRDGRRLPAERARGGGRRPAVDHHADRADPRQRVVVHRVRERVLDPDRDAVARPDALRRSTTPPSSRPARRARAGSPSAAAGRRCPSSGRARRINASSGCGFEAMAACSRLPPPQLESDATTARCFGRQRRGGKGGGHAVGPFG